MNGPDRDHELLRNDLGSFVLGALPAAEEAALQAHLTGCADCRAELEQLLPAASVLADLKHARTDEADERAPAELGPRILAAVRDESARTPDRRRFGVNALTAAAVVAAAAVLVAGVALTRSDPEPTPDVPLEAVAVTVERVGLSAEADLVDHTWGVEVKLTATGFEAGRRYRVSVLGRDGTRYPAGGFVGTGRRPMLCNLNASVLRERASGFEVRGPSGQVVASATFT